MPAVIVRRRKGLFKKKGKKRFRKAIRALIARAASTRKTPFTVKDIDYFPYTNEKDYAGPPLAIELRTMGFPERKKKLGSRAAQALREQIIELPGFPKKLRKRLRGNRALQLLWIQFVDTDGAHV